MTQKGPTMTDQTQTVEQIAAGLSEAQRSIAVSLLGNAWEGRKPTPGINEMNSLELMHIDVLKNQEGEIIRFKAKPTPLGLALFAHLQEQGS